MTVIDEINQTSISDAINKDLDNAAYCAIIGQSPFTPNPIIVDSSDFNCGALSNEIEYARLVCDYYINAMDPNEASGNELDLVINTFINLPRRGTEESDPSFLTRFLSIVAEHSYPNRCTKWAIASALSYFTPLANIQVLEPFDSHNLYFQIRFRGIVSITDILTFDSLLTGFLDQYFIGGFSSGRLQSYVFEIVQRIKAAGVDFDIFTVENASISTTLALKIGRVQQYINISSDILNHKTLTKTIGAKIVT
jgi:hypothetical protein